MQITLKAARVNAGYLQQETAKLLGVAEKTYGRWEKGKSFPDAIQIKKIEELFGVKYDNLIFLV